MTTAPLPEEMRPTWPRIFLATFTPFDRRAAELDLTKLSQLCANAFQIPEKHFLFTFKCKTPHRNIDRVPASVEAHQAFLPSRGDCFFLKFTPCLLLVQSYPGAADGQIRLTGFLQKITQKMLGLAALRRRSKLRPASGGSLHFMTVCSSS